MEEPPPTMLDRWSAEDTFIALEAALSEACNLVDRYRACDVQQKEQVIGMLRIKLQTAQHAADSLMRRVVKGQRL